ncbi:MAG: DUF420 domain-containing protein [Planctomycetota bacterium]|nr:DUF420 domain-containing protein [Planctomycetota bacterium]MDA1113776.1 DUF420 domain-containing protein [Planctomycetota bacterium]
MDDPSIFPPINAALNGFAGLLLLLGFGLIRNGKETAHKRVMLTAFGCSVVFLMSYLYYHLNFSIQVKYAGPDWGKTPYLIMLLAHTVLAAAVPLLAMRTIFLGLKGRRESHRKIARITFPIWLFVSITGVLIYLILYVLTDSGANVLDALRTNS